VTREEMKQRLDALELELDRQKEYVDGEGEVHASHLAITVAGLIQVMKHIVDRL
jgi:hypothetical protein